MLFWLALILTFSPGEETACGTWGFDCVVPPIDSIIVVHEVARCPSEALIQEQAAHPSIHLEASIR